MFSLLVELTLCGTGAVLALLSPWLVMRRAAGDMALRGLARYHLFVSGFVIAALVLFSFRIKPTWLGVATGILSACGWWLGCLWIVLTAAFDGNSPASVELGDGLVCRETVYGFVASDSGQELDIFRRYLFIDHRLYHERRSDVYPGDPVPPPAGLRDAVARCDARLNQRRHIPH
jgi:hypothetical protein